MINSPVQQIKERLSIEDIVSSYIKLDRVGNTLKARCPFHNEKSPSFFVSPERGGYYCFGCSAKGDIFTFVQEFEGLDFRGALKLLAERAGIKLGEYNQKEESEKEKLYRVMEESTKFFEKNLVTNKDGIEYLKNRGLKDETIKDFRIGFAQLDWRTLYDYLKSKNFTDKEIELAGLTKYPDDKNKAMYDRFRGRVMFPICDSSGRVIAFSGRILVDDGKSAKYLNSPETPIFNKSSVLFGIDKAKDSIRKNNFSILVEGQMDLILSHQAGFKNTVASSGTAMTDSTVSKENIINNLGLVQRLSRNIVLAYDADKAGLNASNRFAKIALSLGMDVKVAQMTEGMDPADTISKLGVDSWRESIRNSKHFIEFMLSRILKDTNGDARKMGREIKDILLPIINALESAIEKSHFISLISSKTGIIEGVLLEDLKKVETEHKSEKEETISVQKNIEKTLRKDYIERRLMGVAFWQEGLEKKKIDPNIIFEKLNKVKDIYDLMKEDLVFEAEAFYTNSEHLEKDVKEMLSNIEEEYLNEELTQKMIDLKNVKDKGDEVEILKRINEINKNKEEIKRGR
ncbi:MAG: DNA primase [Candidatus Nomurabacteria bacterium]|nr:DNA primase [Candidatus Nomurabacteria bacterium]